MKRANRESWEQNGSGETNREGDEDREETG